MKNAFRQLHQLLEAREVELSGKIDKIANQKLKNLAAQKDEVETVQIQLASCLSFARESLRTGNQGEVMKMKKTVMKQIKEMTENFKQDKLLPCEQADIKFISSPKLAQDCQQLGEVHAGKVNIHVSLEKCYATGKGLELAKVDELTTAIIHTVSDEGNACAAPVETVKCELESVANDKKMKCSIKAQDAGQYEVRYKSTSRGRHQLHVKVEGKHIKGSPFPVIVKMPVQKLGTPVRVIKGIDSPWGVAVSQRGEIVALDRYVPCISIFSPTGEKVRSFGSIGSGQGQLDSPHGLAVDDDDNILVADQSNHRIQKFTPNGKFVALVGKSTINFHHPAGITLHPISKKIIVSDYNNHCIQILNNDMTFHSKFGSRGQTTYPWDTACDSAGNIYQGGSGSNGIKVFTAEGKFLREFGAKGDRQGELDFPSAIAIDSENIVYVAEKNNHRVSIFKTNGTFLRSFGTRGKEPGQFNSPCGIVVDRDGFIYVSDTDNKRIQIF